MGTPALCLLLTNHLFCTHSPMSAIGPSLVLKAVIGLTGILIGVEAIAILPKFIEATFYEPSDLEILILWVTSPIGGAGTYNSI